jgi:hypothetical protein
MVCTSSILGSNIVNQAYFEEKEMRIEAYLRILSDESTIRTIHRDTDFSIATIGPLNSKKTVEWGELVELGKLPRPLWSLTTLMAG